MAEHEAVDAADVTLRGQPVPEHRVKDLPHRPLLKSNQPYWMPNAR
jgi:hypothetical protein